MTTEEANKFVITITIHQMGFESLCLANGEGPLGEAPKGWGRWGGGVH